MRVTYKIEATQWNISPITQPMADALNPSRQSVLINSKVTPIPQISNNIIALLNSTILICVHNITRKILISPKIMLPFQEGEGSFDLLSSTLISPVLVYRKTNGIFNIFKSNHFHI